MVFHRLQVTFTTYGIEHKWYLVSVTSRSVTDDISSLKCSNQLQKRSFCLHFENVRWFSANNTSYRSGAFGLKLTFDVWRCRFDYLLFNA